MTRCPSPLLAAMALTAGLTAPAAAGEPRNTGVPEPESRVEQVFRLDGGDREITERDFRAAAEVSVRGAGPNWLLRVGGAVTAESLRLRLRNARGVVRFQADAEPLLARLGRWSPRLETGAGMVKEPPGPEPGK